MAFDQSLCETQGAPHTWVMDEQTHPNSADVNVLNRAVSVSLSLDSMSSQMSNINRWSSSSGGGGGPFESFNFFDFFEVRDDSLESLEFGTGVHPSGRRLCQVCGDNASGNHYGVVTCNSCKTFFQRAVARKQNYQCVRTQNCTIDKPRRKNCSSCRLNRCFMLGMMFQGRRLKGTGRVKKVKDEQAPAIWGHGDRGEQSGIPLNLRDWQSPLSILQAIEPNVINAGHNPTQPDSPESLLSSLNQLGERQLVDLMHWAKAMPGFRDLPVDDQLSVIRLSWMGVMVFALGWRSYTFTNSTLLYFAPDLVFNDQRMQTSSMYEDCMRMKQLSQKFFMLKVTQDEFLCMKALVLFGIMPLGLKSQHIFDELRTSYIKQLDRLASFSGEAVRSQRLFELTELLDNLQTIVKKLHHFTYDLFIQAQYQQTPVHFLEMTSEIVGGHTPKILSGMVKPILFHSAVETEGQMEVRS